MSSYSDIAPTTLKHCKGLEFSARIQLVSRLKMDSFWSKDRWSVTSSATMSPESPEAGERCGWACWPCQDLLVWDTGWEETGRPPLSVESDSPGVLIELATWVPALPVRCWLWSCAIAALWSSWAVIANLCGAVPHVRERSGDDESQSMVCWRFWKCSSESAFRSECLWRFWIWREYLKWWSAAEASQMMMRSAARCRPSTERNMGLLSRHSVTPWAGDTPSSSVGSRFSGGAVCDDRCDSSTLCTWGLADLDPQIQG